MQVRELQDEVDEFKEKCSEMEREKEGVGLQLQQAKAKADSEALSRRVAEEDIAELEKEKMMIELELKVRARLLYLNKRLCHQAKKVELKNELKQATICPVVMGIRNISYRGIFKLNSFYCRISAPSTGPTPATWRHSWLQ